MIREAIQKLVQKQDLTAEEAGAWVGEMLDNSATPAQMGAYLSLLAAKGETLEEIIGSLRVMRDKMVKADDAGLSPIDVCGTGGDHKGTFNISTASVFVLVGGGVAVAKHGNRAASSPCGSAEVLQALGVKIDVPLRVVEKCLKETKLCFLFAPHHHPAMKNVGPTRKDIGIRTLFNILGPMSNPACVKRQVIGVFDASKARLIAEALVKTGSERVVAFHSLDGMDEVSCAGGTLFFEAVQGKETVVETTVTPEDFGFGRHPLSDLGGGDAVTNAKIVEEVLNGSQGAPREAVLMAAAAGFYVSGKAVTLKEGACLAAQSLDGGKAREALENLRRVSHS
jgi:anthranilate phosphoribosyltransferase